ncbi:poly-beta-1,6-N-acetyl-D-glucosamine synthase [Pelosinus sp. sgz500959]|uniref:poly-beta-1,6-N-acetyl-D-glucosamine synthase n=1 Tax=Pelosinus sp. sgz500959 TaxID=3242472 RepID=UPI003670E3AA
MSSIIQFIADFVFYYPLAMSIVWIIGALYFYFRHEAGRKRSIPILSSYPMVSVIIPAHNEQDAIESTILGVLESDYPNFEVIVVDDGSKDRTPLILQKLAREHPKVRVLIMKQNMGKPSALRYGFLACLGEIIFAIDADAYVEPDAMRWMVGHFVTGPRVGAVTGNPRVRNRTTLLAKIQVGEYSSIIGMIKRTQRLLGKILTVSGVIAAFRKRALLDVGLWDIDMITDDINVTWKLEKGFWDIRYEPNALCWILVPETIGGLWKQRLRWSQGGGEVIRRHVDIWFSWKQRRLWPIYIEYVVSVFWSYAYVVFGLLWIIHFIIPHSLPTVELLPDWKGTILVALCLVQSMIALYIDNRYEKNIIWYHFWVIWYPLFYWLLTALATVVATPKALFRKMGKLAVWSSPDRGL